MPVDELSDEISAIEAIYPDSVTSEGPRVYTFTIPNHELIKIQVNFPMTYPGKGPESLSIDNDDKLGYMDTTYLEKIAKSFVDKSFVPGQVFMYELLTQLSEFLDEYLRDRIASNVIESKNEELENKQIHHESSVAEAPEEVADKTTDWVKSDIINDRRSTFIAYAREVENLEEASMHLESLLSDKKVSKAAHNISSWRIRSNDNNISYQDCDDDGETAAGGRLLHLLQMMDVWNVVVVVSRYFGGIHLGPDRFKHINAVARDAVTKGGFLQGDTRQKEPASKMKKK
ncbi:hypothetical protein CANMA_002162 [Candida margitis]|uniref:uncharacterized protein n=1 Tax=Candida margitis TaxID=1775924 RepID=UPI002226D00A|nr:uncharacterized protein CANMA_002162 [Candida margitis]KAI5968726.1 hypothetical protein CANMA_002162 [Candida margitis]